MNALDDEDVFGPQTELPPRGPFAQKKVEARKLDLVPRQKPLEMRVEELQVQGIDVFEVVPPLFVPGGALPVHEVFVQRKGHGVEPRKLQLHPKPSGGRGLSRRRGSRHTHQAHGLTPDDLLGDQGQTPGVKGLGNHDDIHGLILRHLLVEARHGAHVQDIEPFAVLPEDVHQPRSGLKIRQGKGRVDGGKAEHHARSIGDEVKKRHGPRGRGQGGIVKAKPPLAGIELHGVLHGPLKKPGLIVVSLGLEDPPGLVQRHHGSADGDVLIHQIPQGLADASHLVGAGGAAGKLTVVGITDGVPNGDLASQGLTAGQHQEKTQGTTIDLHTLEGGGVHQLHRRVLVDDPIQRPQVTVHPPGHHLAAPLDAQLSQHIGPRQRYFGGNAPPSHHIHVKTHGVPRSFIPALGPPLEVRAL